MASSTKWRLNVTANNGRWNIMLADIQFRTSVGSPLEFPGTDCDASNYSGGSVFDALEDGGFDEWSYWETSSGVTTGWWEYTYPAPVEIVSYVLHSGADVGWQDGMPKDFALQYYNGASWVTVDTQTGITGWGISECREFVVGTPGYIPLRGLHKEYSTKWRFNVLSVNGGSQVGITNFQLRRVPGSSYFSDHWTHSPAVTASYATSEATPASNAVSNDAGAAWTTASGTTAASLTLEFEYPHRGVVYSFTSPSAGVAPASFTLEYWDGAGWVLADSRTGQSGTSQTYTITQDTSSSVVPTAGSITWPEMTVTAPYEPLAFLPMASPGGQVLQAASYSSNINLGDPNAYGGMFIATPFTVSATAFLSAAFMGDLEWPLLDVDGALTAGLPLPVLGVAASGYAGGVGQGYITWPDVSVDAGMDPAQPLPLLAVNAVAVAGAVAAGDADLPFMQLAGSLEPALPLPALALDATLANGAVGAALLDWPALSLDAIADNGSVDVRWPQVATTAVALNGAVASGNVSWPKASTDATHAQDTSAVGQVALQPLAMSGVIVSDTLAHGTAVLGQWSVQGSVASGAVTHATITLPLLSVTASGFMDSVGTADIELPLLTVAATAEQQVVAAPVFVTLTLNTHTKAVATHSVGYNSLAQFAGMTLAATPQGIVALMGDTDQGAPIAAHVTSGLSDLGSEQMKRVLCGYVGYRAAGAMDLTLVTDQHHEYVYRLEPRQDAADLHASRVKTGRGVDGRYWQWSLRNTDGQAFELDRLTLDANKLSRRA